MYTGFKRLVGPKKIRRWILFSEGVTFEDHIKGILTSLRDIAHTFEVDLNPFGIDGKT